jgi:hypothetical protein
MQNVTLSIYSLDEGVVADITFTPALESARGECDIFELERRPT